MELFSPFHLLIIAAVVIILFGGKKIPEVMRGMGEGVRGFKEGMRGDPPGTAPPTQVAPPASPAAHAEEKK